MHTQTIISLVQPGRLPRRIVVLPARSNASFHSDRALPVEADLELETYGL